MIKRHIGQRYISTELHHIYRRFATVNVHEKNTLSYWINVLPWPNSRSAALQLLPYLSQATGYGNFRTRPICQPEDQTFTGYHPCQNDKTNFKIHRLFRNNGANLSLQTDIPVQVKTAQIFWIKVTIIPRTYRNLTLIDLCKLQNY